MYWVIMKLIKLFYIYMIHHLLNVISGDWSEYGLVNPNVSSQEGETL